MSAAKALDVGPLIALAHDSDSPCPAKRVAAEATARRLHAAGHWSWVAPCHHGTVHVALFNARGMAAPLTLTPDAARDLAAALVASAARAERESGG